MLTQTRHCTIGLHKISNDKAAVLRYLQYFDWNRRLIALKKYKYLRIRPSRMYLLRFGRAFEQASDVHKRPLRNLYELKV